VRRREFIGLLGGAAAWPVAARAQQPGRVRRIVVLIQLGADDPEAQARLTTFRAHLEQLGWTDRRNVQIDTRFDQVDADRIRKSTPDLVALAPDVILATSNHIVASLVQLTRTVPIVFVTILDPVGAGLVDSLARPGGNATGFTSYDVSVGAKWLELLKEIAPNVKRIGVLRDPEPTLTLGTAQYAVIQSMAPTVGVEVTTIGVRDAGEIERGIGQLARIPDAGLIVPASGWAVAHRHLIIALAAQHKLPAIYYNERYPVKHGGLLSYGLSILDQYRLAAGYVDRILKGEKPGDLPVQQPTKYELVINLKTAKALGLTVPPTLLMRADELIE
jgi:putative tryptophan/tyrosine transport system substrate-binding protein